VTALTNLSDIVNRVTGGNSGTPEHLWFTRKDRLQGGAAPVATVAGRLTSLWGWAGVPSGIDISTPTGSVSTTPGTGVNPTRASSGALKQANPGGGRQKWLLGMEVVSNQVGALLLYDRLMQVSGLSGTSTGTQTITSGTITRNTGGDGNQLYAEVYTAIGATATTITASYTNQANVSGKTTVAVAIGGAGYQEVGRMVQLPLAAGDTGVKSVQNVTLVATTGTTGDFGITIARPLCFDAVGQVGAGFPRDMITGLPSLPEIVTDAALALAWLASGTTAPEIFGAIHSIEA
jgi:hypothetical protein